MLKECCERCKDAKPTSPCHCRCGGRYHGINRITEEYPEEYFRALNESLGGEVGEIIHKLSNEKFHCWCGKRFTVKHFLGYEHDGGIVDSQGTKWWVFIVCPFCRYEWSWHKLENRLNRLIEKKRMFKQQNLVLG